MNIDQAPKTIKQQFEQALSTREWLAALSLLATHEMTVRPSQAPELRAAIRSNRELLATNSMVETASGARRMVDGHVLEPDREGDMIVASWLDDSPTVEERFAHFSAHPKAQYRIHHFVMMGDLHAALGVLRATGTSCRHEDYSGELAAAIREHVDRPCIVRDARSMAILPIQPFSMPTQLADRPRSYEDFNQKGN